MIPIEISVALCALARTDGPWDHYLPQYFPFRCQLIYEFELNALLLLAVRRASPRVQILVQLEIRAR